jgi:O-antigen/teichoic acid export membrane protein
VDQLTENYEPDVPALPPSAVAGASQPGLGVRVFQNVTAMLGGRVLGLFFSTGTSILLARYLGRERLGEYGAIYAYLALYGFFATFCLEQILARETTLRRHQAAEILHTGTLTALSFSLTGAILAPLLAPLFGYSGSLRWLIAIAAVDMLILPPIRFRGIIFQVEMRFWYSVAIGLFRQALWLLAVLCLALKSAVFYEVILARTLCGAAEAVAVLWTVHRLGLISGSQRFLSSEARLMLRQGFPLVLTTLAGGIYHRIDQVMIHKMSGDQVLGPYVIAVQLTELFSALPVMLMSALFPALSQSANDPPRFNRYLRESYRFLLVLVFAACAVVTPIAAPFIELFYGKQFLTTAPLLVVLIWSEVPIFFGVALGSAVVARGLQRYTPYGAIAGAFANILLNLVLIPRYGALGASWATVISYAIAGILCFLIFAEVRPMVTIGLRASIWPLILALAITFSLVLLQVSFWWKFLIALLAYAIGALLTGTIERADLSRLRQMFRGSLANV